MYFFIYGLVAAILTFGGFTLAGVKSNGAKIGFAILAFIVMGAWGWLAMPAFGWNFSGNWWLLLIVGAVIVVVSWLAKEEIPPLSVWAPVILVCIMLIPVALMTTFSMFHAGSYHRLLGEPIVSEFNADVSPVSVNQVRRVDQDLAYTLASKRVEEDPGLGSRVDLAPMNIQTLNGTFDIQDGNGEVHTLTFENELVWVGPLAHSGMFKAISNGTTPGYVLISATDPTKVFMVNAIRSVVVSTEDGEDAQRMGSEGSQEEGFAPINLAYLNTGGYFGGSVERHVRTSGYIAGLTDYSFEINDEGRPHWVITQYEKAVGFSGENATGVVVVDAITGAIQDYSIEDAPAWIDRIQPESIVTNQLNSWGLYVQGFWNAIFAKQDVVKTTPGMSLVYGADGQSYWYSGIQSSGSDQSTNSFVLVNTRTKEVRRYMIAGSNESAARASAENAPGVREARYVGIDPVLYNVAGEPTYFVPLKGGDGLVKMFAFVSVRNFETVGVGRNPQAALRDYQNNLIREGGGVQLDDLTTQERVEAAVLKTVQIGDTFYLLLDGQEGVEFYGTDDVSPELKWATSGQTVVVVFEQGASESVQLYGFDIPALSISTLSD